MSKIEIVDKLDVKEISSKDMSRREFYQYILGDLARGSYIVGSLFLDVIGIPQILSFIPVSYFYPQLSISIGPADNPVHVPVLFLITFIVLALVAMYFEVKYYIRIWRS